MLKKVKRFIDLVKNSDEDFHQYYIKYMMKVQDMNIDNEIQSQLRYGLLQLSQYDTQIETDYRRLLNESNA